MKKIILISILMVSLFLVSCVQLSDEEIDFELEILEPEQVDSIAEDNSKNKVALAGQAIRSKRTRLKFVSKNRLKARAKVVRMKSPWLTFRKVAQKHKVSTSELLKKMARSNTLAADAINLGTKNAGYSLDRVLAVNLHNANTYKKSSKIYKDSIKKIIKTLNIIYKDQDKSILEETGWGVLAEDAIKRNALGINIDLHALKPLDPNEMSKLTGTEGGMAAGGTVTKYGKNWKKKGQNKGVNEAAIRACSGLNQDPTGVSGVDSGSGIGGGAINPGGSRKTTGPDGGSTTGQGGLPGKNERPGENAGLGGAAAGVDPSKAGGYTSDEGQNKKEKSTSATVVGKDPLTGESMKVDLKTKLESNGDGTYIADITVTETEFDGKGSELASETVKEEIFTGTLDEIGGKVADLVKDAKIDLKNSGYDYKPGKSSKGSKVGGKRFDPNADASLGDPCGSDCMAGWGSPKTAQEKLEELVQACKQSKARNSQKFGIAGKNNQISTSKTQQSSGLSPGDPCSQVSPGCLNAIEGDKSAGISDLTGSKTALCGLDKALAKVMQNFEMWTDPVEAMGTPFVSKGFYQQGQTPGEFD